MTNLASDFQSALQPAPQPPLPDEIPRENVRLLIQMLGFPVSDVREVSITPSQILVEVVMRGEEGEVVMMDGLAAYRVAAVRITEPDGSTAG